MDFETALFALNCSKIIVTVTILKCTIARIVMVKVKIHAPSLKDMDLHPFRTAEIIFVL